MTVCSDWLTGDDVFDCCEVEGATSGDIFDDAAAAAQELLFEFSGRRFPGICTQTVRPCRTTCGCSWQVLSRGHIVWNPNFDQGWWWCDDNPCGCRPLSKVPLSGYVQSVTEVKIDGTIISDDTYRVDNHRWLVRVRPTADDDVSRWPGCQNLDLPDTEEGTWSVTYTYGVEVPSAGVRAAVELACEIFKACNGDQCKLPKGTVRLARQGVVIEKTPFASWGFESGRNGSFQRGWQTGLAAVDAFLNAYNPNGLPREPIFWSPASVGRYAQKVG